MSVSGLEFLEDGTAVVQMENCRRATALRDFFFDRGYHMKSQSAGRLILPVPEVPVGTDEFHSVEDHMESIYQEFLRL